MCFNQVEQECFASPAPYGVLGDPVELFNVYPTNPKAASLPLHTHVHDNIPVCMIPARALHSVAGSAASSYQYGWDGVEAITLMVCSCRRALLWIPRCRCLMSR